MIFGRDQLTYWMATVGGAAILLFAEYRPTVYLGMYGKYKILIFPYCAKTMRRIGTYL